MRFKKFTVCTVLIILSKLEVPAKEETGFSHEKQTITIQIITYKLNPGQQEHDLLYTEKQELHPIFKILRLRSLADGKTWRWHRLSKQQ